MLVHSIWTFLSLTDWIAKFDGVQPNGDQSENRPNGSAKELTLAEGSDNESEPDEVGGKGDGGKIIDVRP
jgi:hypothetical protein